MQFLQDRAGVIITILLSSVLFSLIVASILNLVNKYAYILFLAVRILLKNRKEVAYQVIFDVPILSPQEEAKDEVKVISDGEPITDVRLIVLQIWNSGDVTVLPKDFNRPIKFSFGKKAKVLEAGILEKTPDNLQVSLLLGEWDVIIPPLLLKSNDSIKLKVLLSGFKGKIRVDARIVGVGLSLIDRTIYTSPQELAHSYQRRGKSLIGL